MKLEIIDEIKTLTVDDHPSSPGVEMTYEGDEEINAYKAELEQTIDGFNALESMGKNNPNNDILKERFITQLNNLNNLI